MNRFEVDMAVRLVKEVPGKGATAGLAASESGFTLIEVLVAFSILAIGILAVATMQISAIQGNARSMWYTEAATRATDRMEILMGLDYTHADLVDTVTPGNPAHQVVDADGYTTQWTVEDDGANFKTINVTVLWMDHNIQKDLSMDLIRSRDK